MKALRSVALLAVATFAGAGSPNAQTAPDAWIEPQDTAAAVNQPDLYAWRVFIALNWPADVAQKTADKSKAFGAPGSVVWETWRNVRPDAPDTVFPTNGSDPGPWLGSGAPVVARNERSFDAVPRQQQMFAAQQALISGGRRAGGPVPAFDPVAAAAFGSEVRMNRPAYEFVRGNELFNIEGQIAQANSGKATLTFPAGSKEIKAVWRQITEVDKPRYHWAEVTVAAGGTRIWGLTGLHITTKDIPNWFWATWEHIDNKTPRPGVNDAPPNEGWLVPSVDRVACPAPPHDCELAPPGLGLQGTKWENYRLRGTQIDFVTSMGDPIVLANSQIELGFQRRSSCTTCHADAVIDRQGNRLPFTLVLGAPDPSKFRDSQTRQRVFMQLDFLWSLTRASSRAPQQ